MMKVAQKLVCSLAVAGLMTASANAAVTVDVQPSAAPWIGYMNVFNLPIDGGAFQFGGSWGVPDLVTTFNDGAGTMTLSPNTIGDPDPYWYIGGGAPGNPGNKIMEAATYIENDLLAGEDITFEGTVLSNSYTAAHEAFIFIRDFAPDFSSFNETSIPATVGAFSINLVTDPAPGRHIQYGFVSRGENVWAGDEGPFGSVVIGTIPEPASLALLGLGGLVMLRRK
jgi:PEP-CTERM motif-containing protein